MMALVSVVVVVNKGARGLRSNLLKLKAHFVYCGLYFLTKKLIRTRAKEKEFIEKECMI